ncbi:putative yebC-like protein [Lyophyllum shimeji]|uniref:YebC-like protein n=1 Tax=Lyophyllum shimeji TaxID=47721 RepID=A0A9P3UJC0_LYOSH|nr:putative yebC-like protein [Lyophyllum shimeji]
MIRLGALTLPTRRSFTSCLVNSAGHNKWSKIKQRKGANDAQKGVVFGKAARDIVMAVRNGGGTDPTKNLQLAAVLKRAKELDVPKENIEKALAKASQGKDQNGEAFVYEALAFNSVGLIIECATDNNNRTIHSLREILNDYGARAAPVKFMFQRVGYVTAHRIAQSAADTSQAEANELVELALSNGAIDFDNTTDSTESTPSFWFTCEPAQLQALASSVLEQFRETWDIGVREVRYIPLQDPPQDISDIRDDLKTLIEELEMNEDVLEVWSTVPHDT